MSGYLADTNVVVRFANPASVRHSLVRSAINSLRSRQELIHITPQICIELWSVCTRPSNVNGLGWTVEQTQKALDALLEFFPLLPDTQEVFIHWLALVTKHSVQGRQVHDARLVAVMQAHGLTHLLTLNVEDFKRFTEIKPIHPDEVKP